MVTKQKSPIRGTWKINPKCQRNRAISELETSYVRLGVNAYDLIHGCHPTIGQPTMWTSPLIGASHIVSHTIVLHWELDEDTVFPGYIVRIHLGVTAMASVAAAIGAVAGDRHEVRSLGFTLILDVFPAVMVGVCHVL